MMINIQYSAPKVKTSGVRNLKKTCPQAQAIVKDNNSWNFVIIHNVIQHVIHYC
mgnify:FL=1